MSEVITSIDPKIAKALISGKTLVFDEELHYGIQLDVSNEPTMNDDRMKAICHYLSGYINGMATAYNTKCVIKNDSYGKWMMFLEDHNITAEEYVAIKKAIKELGGDRFIHYVRILREVLPVMDVSVMNVSPIEYPDVE